MKQLTQVRLGFLKSLSVGIVLLVLSILQAAAAPIFFDGFESYNLGVLDKDFAGPNAAPNGSGNPWFGPAPPNLYVVVSGESGVTAHSGAKMLRGSGLGGDLDQCWVNIAYRFNGGTPYTGNIMLDWWFYDLLGSGGANYQDFVAIGYYGVTPTTTDYPFYSAGDPHNGSLNYLHGNIQRISLGGSSYGAPDTTKYQARVVGSVDGYGGGWLNTTFTRSVGWHRGRIIIGPAIPDGTADIAFYIDDLTVPILVHNSETTYGFNVIELNANYGGTPGIVGYYDELTFDVAPPPNLKVSLSGKNAVLTWLGPWFLQSASDVNGPYSDVAGATTPYSYDTTQGPQQFFRVRN